MKLYEMLKGDELKIAQKIQQRRLQILAHSYIYYEKDTNIISDHEWTKFGKELIELQRQFPNIANQVDYADAFKDWDVGSGAFLPYDDEKIISVALHLLQHKGYVSDAAVAIKTQAPKIPKKEPPVKRRSLF